MPLLKRGNSRRTILQPSRLCFCFCDVSRRSQIRRQRGRDARARTHAAQNRRRRRGGSRSRLRSRAFRGVCDRRWCGYGRRYGRSRGAVGSNSGRSWGRGRAQHFLGMNCSGGEPVRHLHLHGMQAQHRQQIFVRLRDWVLCGLERNTRGAHRMLSNPRSRMAAARAWSNSGRNLFLTLAERRTAKAIVFPNRRYNGMTTAPSGVSRNS